ncbi:MAG: alkaline phosphatase [Pseudomonadota bacterium]
MHKTTSFLCLLVIAMQPASAQELLPDAQRTSTWFIDGAQAVEQAARREDPKGKARNIILFVGDGMSVTTTTAARILAGQQAGGPGEEHVLSFERFPHTGLVKTYNTDAQVPDSAGTMSAMMTGAKTNIGMLGVGPDAVRESCTSQQEHTLPSYLELAELNGMATGVISTARLTHATPAATYSKAVNRGWEDVSDMPPAVVADGCEDIAAQFVGLADRLSTHFGIAVDGIEVAFGGGRRHFLPADSRFNSPDASSDVEGDRTDGRHLINEWLEQNPEGRYVMDRDGFDAIDTSKSGPVLGLFSESHMRYSADRLNDEAGEPSLAEMTRTAIELLRQEPDGFFLMVEGGRIDHAHHAGSAYHALHDTLALDAAVAVASEMTNVEDTLIIVTADHGHVLTMGGYAKRGNPILGLASRGGEPNLAADSLPYTTLSYANGPGMRFFPGITSPDQAPRQLGKPREARVDLSQVDTTAPGFFQQSLVPLPSETHSGDDVAVYARGPGAQTLNGVIEQSAVFDLLNSARNMTEQIDE